MAQNPAPPRDWTDDYLDTLAAGGTPTPPPRPLGESVPATLSDENADLILSVLEKYGGPESMLQSGWRGFVESGAQALAAPGQALGKAMGMTYDTQNEAIARGVDALAPEQPTVDAIGSTARTVGSAFGSVAPMLATGMVAGPVAAGAYGFGMGANEMADSLRYSEVDDGAKLGYMAANGLVGVADMLPVGRLLRRLNIVSGGAVGVGLSRIDLLRQIAGDAPTAYSTLRSIAKQTGLGAATEAGQQILTNALVAHATDEDMDLLRGAGQEALGGGVVESVLGTVIEMATLKRRSLRAVGARFALPAAEWQNSYLNDPEFRAAVDADYLEAAMASAQERVAAGESGITDLAGQVAEQVATPGGDFIEGATGQFAPGPVEPSERVSRPARVSEAEAMASQTVEEPPRYADGTLYEEGMRPNAAEYSRRPGAPEGSQAPASPAAASGEQATVSRAVPLPAPSSEAAVPVQGQAGPQGQPVYPITGSSHVGAWGGTRENTIGAKSPTRRSDVAASITDVLERLGVRVERFMDSTGNPVVGIYRPGGLVQTDPYDIPAFAHELGHALHRVLMQNQRSGAAAVADWDSALTGLDPAVQGELRKLGALQATGQPGRELTEGMAELVRMWVMSPEALTVAPKAKAWLEGWVLTQPRAIKNALVEAQQRARAYRYQGDLLRTQVAPESTPFTRTLARLRGIGPKIAQTVYDEAYAADRFDQRMEAMGVAGGISLRDRIRAMRNIARGLFTNFMHGAPTDFYGNHLEIPNFDAIVGRLGRGEQRLFGDYLHARATLAHEATGYNTGMAPADAVNKLETLARTHPHFEAVADALQEWFASVNKVLAAYSPTYAAEMQRIEASDAVYGIDFYVPLKRYFSEQEGGGASGRKTLVGTGEVSRRRTSGSNRLTLNPLESLANEARTRLERAVYRNAMESMVSLHDAALEGGTTDSGADPWIREIHGGDVVGGTFDPTTQEGFEALGDVLAGPSLQGKRVLVQVRDATGRRRVFSMDPKIAALAITVDPLTLRQGSSFLSYLIGPLSASRRALVATTITYNPVFQYFTNPLYDLTTAYLVSDYMRWQDLSQLVGTFTANVTYGVLSSFNIRTDKWETMYEALGLHASTSSMSELSVGRSVRGVNKPATKISNMFEVLGRIMSVPQRATQIALMQKAAKARGINIANMSETDAMYMRLAARQPVDYGAGSAMSRRWQAVVPFLRATLEGQKQMAEAWSGNRVEFLMKLGVLMALQTAVRYLFGDDDLEASKTADERLRVLSIPLSNDPDGEVLQIRIPSELAVLTGAPAILYDAMRGQGADTTEMGMAALMSIFPPTILDNPLVATAMQQISGKRQPIKSWFTETADAPLTPAEYEGKEPTAQKGSQTAPLVVRLAETQDAALAAMGFAPTHHLRQVFGSPVRMESAISTALGGNALLAIEGFGLVPALAPARQYDPGELTAGAFRRGGMTSWQDPNIRLIYELDSQAKMTQRTRDGTQPEDVMTMLRRQSIAKTAQALTNMRLLSTHEEEGMTVKGRRDLTRRAQVIAREAVKELQLGGPTRAYIQAADIGIRRQVNDLNQGKFFK